MKHFFRIILVLFSIQISYAQEDGSFKDYYDSGELKSEGSYQNKQKIGAWKYYHKNGQVSRLYHFIDGKPIDEEISYFEDGKIRQKTEKIGEDYIVFGYYESGKLKYQRQLKSGYYKSFFENGTLEIEANYKDNELSGEWKSYYNSGALEWLVNYQNGERNGVYKQFYENGNPKLEGNNVNDKKEGRERRFLPNMILEWKGDYNKDRLHSTWTKYNTKGKKVDKIKYFYGSVSDSKNGSKLSVTKVPDGVLEKIAIYPGCESFKGNQAKKNCMNDKVNKIIRDNFNISVGTNAGLSGKQRIFVTFKVNKSGEVVDIYARAAHPNLELEAIRVISLLPKLKPAKQKGESVAMPFSLPIIFQL